MPLPRRADLPALALAGLAGFTIAASLLYVVPAIALIIAWIWLREIITAYFRSRWCSSCARCYHSEHVRPSTKHPYDEKHAACEKN